MGASQGEIFRGDQPTGDLIGRARDSSSPGIIQPNAFHGEVSPGTGKIPRIDIQATGFRPIRVLVLANADAPLAVLVLSENQRVQIPASELGRDSRTVGNEDHLPAVADAFSPFVDEEFSIEWPKNSCCAGDNNQNRQRLQKIGVSLISSRGHVTSSKWPTVPSTDQKSSAQSKIVPNPSLTIQCWMGPPPDRVPLS
jgi:hypothetical protein